MLAAFAQGICATLAETASSAGGRDGYIKTGMIPKGTSVNLVANLDPDFQHIDVFAKIAEKLGISPLKKPDFTRNHLASATQLKVK